ncbi:MAG: host-nuclease inhibitor Gam family protein [Sphingomonas sp.]|uniref:host-nuclease inhibitor Gam family protein n=1 Tax=Sphingomonas sp. TaxID=28214 RepID=UPI0025EBA726|nr:host-nuclease inhibitor Gam family protein [Sphingomonas sp.]MBX9881228.1 host-nuclease inhibitor Gam family protein [Sphingomonas sp.]
MTARRKAPALAAPATLEEAKAMLARYQHLAARADGVKAAVEEAIANARKVEAEQLAPLESELRQIFAALKTWWAVAGAEIAGKRRSAELAGVEIGVRRSPPALKMPKGLTMKALIQAMLGKGLIGWLRIKYELDRPGIVATITGNNDHDLAKMGFAAEAKDEFFIALRPLETATEETDA